MSQSPTGPLAVWPELPYAAWRDTQQTLHLWTQIVGKAQLALTPFLNEWWNIAFALTARGMTTGLLPARNRAVQIDFDFIEHTLIIRADNGATRTLPLEPRSVADFYAAFLAALRALDVAVTIDPVSVELPVPIRLDQDATHAAYDPDPVTDWWRIQVQIVKALQRFRASFVGKSSPIQFFWGGFDLSHTRFSGRPASPPASWPRFLRLGEDQENFACGFWPGNVTMSGLTLGEPAFYAYAFPEPPGFRDAAALPDGAVYHPDFGEFLLPYATVRESATPEATLLAFFGRTYAAAAETGRWDRVALERPDYARIGGRS